jgi:hypothetical protein
LFRLPSRRGLVIEIDFVFGQFQMLDRELFLHHQHVDTAPADLFARLDLDREFMRPWFILHVNAQQGQIG